MNPILKWGAGALLAVALFSAGYLYFASEAILDKTYPLRASTFHAPRGDAAAVARGEHLTLILGCANCHDGDLAGMPFADVPGSKIYGRNLTLLRTNSPTPISTARSAKASTQMARASWSCRPTSIRS